MKFAPRATQRFRKMQGSTARSCALPVLAATGAQIETSAWRFNASVKANVLKRAEYFERLRSIAKITKEAKMKSASLLLSALVLLGGCASARQTYTADGSTGHSIDCSGTARNWGMCFEKAGEICGTRGYEVLNRSGDQGAVATANQYGGFAGSVISRTLIIQCKK